MPDHRFKVAQLIPEFPGQTHIFFWREMQELAKMGVDCEIVSTRRPEASIVCHEWSAEAIARTTYLFPPGVGEAMSGVWTMLAAGPARWARAAGVVLGRGVGGLKDRVKLLAFMVLGARLARLAELQGWRHVHAQSAGDSAYLALFASIFGDLTYSVVLHSPVNCFGHGQRQKWGGAAFGQVITETLREELLREVPTIAPGKLDIASMGVDTDVFVRSAPYEPWHGSGPVRVVSCGRLNPVKGHQDVIRAMALLRDRGVDASLAILGEGPARDMLTALVDDLKIGDRVSLKGAVNEAAVRGEIERSHVFCLASHAEPLGVAIMEGMAMGLPVIVGRGGGVHELVRDGVDGLFVTPERPEEIAGAIERLARDADLAVRFGRAGRERVLERFSSRSSAEVIVRRVRGLGSIAQHESVPGPGSNRAPSSCSPSSSASSSASVGGPR